MRILCALGLHSWWYRMTEQSPTAVRSQIGGRYRWCDRCSREEEWREVPTDRGPWEMSGSGRYDWLHLEPMTDFERTKREREPGKPWSPRNTLHRS